MNDKNICPNCLYVWLCQPQPINLSKYMLLGYIYGANIKQ